MARFGGTEKWRDVRTLRQAADFLGKSADEMLTVVEGTFTETLYTREAVKDILGVSDEELVKLSLSGNTRGSKRLMEIFLLLHT